MHPPARVTTDFDAPAHFEVPQLSRREDLRSFAGIVTNYAENGLSCHLRHGYAYRARLPIPTLALAHPRHHYRVLRSNVLNYPKGSDYELLRPILGNGLFVSDGELWTRQRRLLSAEFRPNVVQRFIPPLVDSVEAIFREWSKGPRGAVRDVSEDMMKLTIWGVGGALFHNDFREQAEDLGHALEVCLAQGTLQMMSMGLLRPWMPTPGNLRAQRAARRLDALVLGIIADHRRRGGEHGMLSRLLVLRDEETGAGMEDTQLLDELKSLILAGHETTSLTLSWALYLLAKHPEVQARLVEEVTAVLGGRAPTAEDLPRLELTQRVMQETMRLYPPVPAVTRTARADDHFDGIEVRAGERVALNIYATHRHPELWDRPERFDPDRFAPERSESLAPYSYLPFLLGRRACLGEHFAMIEGVVALAMIVDRFRAERADEAPIGTRPISTLRLASPLRMRLFPRRASA